MQNSASIIVSLFISNKNVKVNRASCFSTTLGGTDVSH